MILAAGLAGIENEYPLPPKTETNIAHMTDEERDALGIETLPGSLLEAVQATEDSELVREALGDHAFNSFIQNKKIEWETYRAQVTDYEVKRYLPLL